jgi:hypothetical protein
MVRWGVLLLIALATYAVASGTVGFAPAQPPPVEWGGAEHESRDALAAWLEERGGSYEGWAALHPAAAEQLQRVDVGPPVALPRLHEGLLETLGIEGGTAALLLLVAAGILALAVAPRARIAAALRAAARPPRMRLEVARRVSKSAHELGWRVRLLSAEGARGVRLLEVGLGRGVPGLRQAQLPRSLVIKPLRVNAAAGSVRGLLALTRSAAHTLDWSALAWGATAAGGGAVIGFGIVKVLAGL